MLSTKALKITDRLIRWDNLSNPLSAFSPEPFTIKVILLIEVVPVADPGGAKGAIAPPLSRRKGGKK